MRHHRDIRLVLAAGAILSLMLTGCRGQQSSDPPIRVFGDMDWQPRYQAQGASSFFADGRAMRPIVDGTVARGHLDEDDAYFRGQVNEVFVAKAPIKVDARVVKRGEERYNIFCTPCHDRTGSGGGLVVKRGYPLPPSLTSDHTRGLADGEVFNIITHGQRSMPSYRSQVPVEDRWAIVVWLRVLQRAAHGALTDVPADSVGRIEPEATP